MKQPDIRSCLDIYEARQPGVGDATVPFPGLCSEDVILADAGINSEVSTANLVTAS
jgi:hypothetical protein